MVFILITLILELVLSDKVVATVYYAGSQNGYVVEEGKFDENGLCFGSFEDSFYEKGWDILFINTTRNFSYYSDFQITYCAGILEGYLTRARIYMFYRSMSALAFFQSNGTMPKFAQEFLTEQKEWVNTKGSTDDFWKAAETTYFHLYGMVEGYNYEIANETQKLSYWDIYMMYSLGDMMDVLKLNQDSGKRFFTEEFESIVGQPRPSLSSVLSPHCSAFISRNTKDDDNDIYFAHTTWALYSMMTRIFKMIHIQSSNPLLKSSGIFFSSYPAAVGSSDDFYITSSDLFVQETTLTCFNDSLSKLIKPQSLLYWQRTLLANRLSSNPKVWADYFSRENSGTYNNEWMVLDAKEYYNSHIIKRNQQREGIRSTSNLLYVVDQIPGTVDSFDLSSKFMTEDYFPSYNLPYSKNVYDICEIPQQLKKHPEQNASLDYDHCARANIFRKFLSSSSNNNNNNNNMEDMKNLIRYNNYKNDPLTLHDPSFTISSRTDLEAPSSAFCSGAIDGKIVSVKEWMESRKLWIVSGPTTDGVPAFDYSKTMVCDEMPFIKHYGQPEVWKFPWINIQVQ